MYNRMYNGEKGVDAIKKDVALWATREGCGGYLSGDNR